jgi:gas vesicle protein
MTDYERFGETGIQEERSGFGLGTALTFLFVGIGVGAVSALLLAPKSGRQMRRMLKRKYEDARESFDEFADQAGDWAEDVAERGSKYAKTGAKYARTGADWAKGATSKVAKVRSVLR